MGKSKIRNRKTLKLKIMIFTIEIWFRYIMAGEQEKNFEAYNVEALDIHDAFRIIKEKHFKTRAKIPFSYERLIDGNGDGNIYKP